MKHSNYMNGYTLYKQWSYTCAIYTIDVRKKQWHTIKGIQNWKWMKLNVQLRKYKSSHNWTQTRVRSDRSRTTADLYLWHRCIFYIMHTVNTTLNDFVHFVDKWTMKKKRNAAAFFVYIKGTCTCILWDFVVSHVLLHKSPCQLCLSLSLIVEDCMMDRWK